MEISLSTILYIVSDFISIAFFHFLVPLFIVFLVILYIILRWVFVVLPYSNLENDYKWIRRELRLLNSLLKDAEQVRKSGSQIDEEAHRRWPTEELKGITARLQETDEEWLKKAKELAEESTNRIANVEQRRGGKGKSFKWIDTTKVKEVKGDIEAHLKTESVSEICGTLEKLRYKIRSLQDRPIDVEQKPISSELQVGSEAALIDSLMKEVNKLIADASKQGLAHEMEKEIQLLHLELIRTFLTDLKGFGLETELEKTWLEEAKEIVGEAQHAIDTFKQETRYQKWNLSSVVSSTERARCELTKEMKCSNTGFSDFLERKKRYGFQFSKSLIRRHQPKSESPDQQASEFQTLDDDIMSNLKKIKEKVRLQNIESEKLTKVFTKFKEVREQFEKAKTKEGINSSTEERLKQMKKLANKADLSVNSYKENSPKDWNFLIFKTKCQKKLYKEFEQIDGALDILARSIEAYGIELKEEMSSVVGLEEDIHELVSQLKSGSENFSFVSIVGMMGIGKTTLAKKIYEHSDIEEHFPFRAWVSVPQETDCDALSIKVAKQVLGDKSQEELNGREIREYWMNKVCDFLKETKYLVVLDNFTAENAWETLKTAFPETNGSRIVLTTRYRNVAMQVDPSREPHQLKLQTKEDSWRLFIQRVHFLSALPQKVEELAKDFVRRCGGLPGEILRFGYRMSGTNVNDLELPNVLKKINPDPKPWHEIHEIADKAWSDDPSNTKEWSDNLRNFFPFIKLFPSGYEIPTRRLVALGVAKGLEKSVAEDYLNELIGRNIIQVVERKLNGKVKKCCLPSALKQIFDNSDGNGLSLQDIHHTDTSRPSLPLSYIDDNFFLSFDTREGNKPGELIGNSLRIGIKSFQRLQILDLEHVFRPQLPNNIGNLHDLWYLGLRWTYLESIPSSIGNLTNLQTLDMKHTYIREVPGSIWRLKKLQHLYLNHNYRSKIVHHRSANSLRNLPIVMSQPRSNSPKNLQTLWGVFIDEDSFLKHQLDKLTSLEKLGLAFELTSSQEKTLECIVGLNKLKYLELRSIDETGEPKNLYLKSLENLPNLSNLYLFGRLEIPSIISKFPLSLTYLTLSASGLKDDPMPSLGKLPNLKSLCFYSGSYKGIEMVCWDGFPQLLVLKLWKLEFLEKLQVEDKAMQNMTELEIRCCDKLEVPTGLKYLKSLQELKLTNMPETFTATIERKKWQIWNDIAFSPMIIKDNW